MVWNLAVQKNTGTYTGTTYPYVSASAVRNVYENPWSKYFASSENSSVQPVKSVNTYDAMACLNAINETETNEETKASSTQDTKEAEKKEKAQKKLAKLSENLQNNKTFELSQKHNDALNMIKNNPDLASLDKTIKEKLASVFNQSAFLQSKVLLTQSQSDLTADNILNVVNDVKQMFAQLQKDWQKITSCIIKAGAYSEAMMKVDNQEKKDKYKSKAYEMVASMPDAFGNKQEAMAVEQELEELNGQEAEDDYENSEADTEPEPEITLENPSDSNPFVLSDKSETSDVDENEMTDDDSDSESASVLDEISSEEKDEELDGLKKEVKEELEIQKKRKKNKTNNYYQEYIKEKAEMLNSVLFAA